MKAGFLILLFLIQGPTLPQIQLGVVSGQVLGIDGMPAVNIRVSAMEVPNGTAGAPALVGFAQTDGSGRYRIESVPPGRYYILAGPLESPSYYPGAADLTGATAVSVVAGAQLEALNFSLNPGNQSGIIQVAVQQIDTAAPIAGANVTLRRPNTSAQEAMTATTDANGQVTIGGLTSGQYTVTVQSEGYVGPTGRGGQAPPSVSAQATVNAEQKEARIVFSLNAGALIEGRIQSPTGQPAPNVRMTAMRMGFQDGRRALISAGPTVQTDAQGRYSLTLGAGEYYIRMESPAGRLRATEILPAVAYYPGVVELGKAKPIVVGNGQVLRGSDITIPMLKGVTISGTIINRLPGGRSTAAGAVNRIIASMYLIPRHSDILDSNAPLIQNLVALTARPSATSEETPFEIRGVLPGEYDFYPLFADNAQGTGTYFTARTPITVGDQDIGSLVVTLRPNSELKGRFVLEGDVGSIRWDSVRVQAQPKEFLPNLVRGTVGTVGQVADPGSRAFIFSSLAESSFGILVQGVLPATAYVADIRQGNKSIYSDGIVNTRTGPSDLIEIVLRPGAATIQGTVRNNANLPAYVVLRPVTHRQNSQLYKRATANPSGQFTISGIAPGDYMLYAFPSLLAGGAEENAEFMAKYESQGRAITLNTSQVERVELTLIADASLALPDRSAAVAPQISNRVIKSPDTPIITAESATAANFQRRGSADLRAGSPGAAADSAVATLARAGLRGTTAAAETIEQNLVLTPTSPEQRAQLLAFLLQTGVGNIVYNKPVTERLWRRGQELDPSNPQWGAQLGLLYSLAADDPIARLSLTPVEASAKSLQEYEKAFALGNSGVLSEMAYSARRANALEKAVDYATRAIATGDPDYMHDGNSTLGLIALEKGDIEAAKKYLLASGNVRGSPVLGSLGPGMNLASELLRKGERDTVLAYLEECLKFWSSGEEQLKGWIATLKTGGLPNLNTRTGR